MKTRVNFVMLFIALIALGFYSGNRGKPYVWLLTITSGVFGFVTLVLAISFDVRGAASNVRIVSAVFLAGSLIGNLIFTFAGVTPKVYVIVNGLLFLVFVLIGYTIIRALK